LRYAAESAAPVIGKPAQRTAAAAEQLQTTLGELHDAVQAEAWLRDKPEEPGIPAAVGFAAGMLCRDQQYEQQRLRQEWQSDWKRIRSKKNRSWLHS
jgi:CHAD domain-containing protein